MQIFVFIFYIILSAVFLRHYTFEKNTGLSIWVIIGLFTLKVLAGTINLYVHFYEYVSNDIGFYHWQAVNELKAMHLNPSDFFCNWILNWGDFSDGFNYASPRFNAFWKDIGVLFHTKYMTLANILSLGNQYVNVVIYNIPFFIGQLYLYKTFYMLQPEKKWLYVLVIFCIPAVLFWCSGIHKDGWVLTAFGFIFYSLSSFLITKNRKYIISLILSILLLFITRYFYLIALLPLLFLWVYTRNKKHKSYYYIAALCLTALLFFNTHRIFPSVNPMKLIQGRQTEFFGYIGYSDMKTPKLENNFMSYVRNFPTAVNHILLQPELKRQSPLKYKFAAIDNYLVLLMMVTFAVYIKRKFLQNTMFISILLYAVSIYLFIGYTIPNCGALVRYKSEFTVLLLAALVSLSELPKVNHFLNNKLSGSK